MSPTSSATSGATRRLEIGCVYKGPEIGKIARQMDEVSSYVRLDLPLFVGKAAVEIVPPRLRIPWWKGLGADSEEKQEPASDINIERWIV